MNYKEQIEKLSFIKEWFKSSFPRYNNVENPKEIIFAEFTIKEIKEIEDIEDIEYKVLIEHDSNHIDTGIYYGIKAITKKTKILKQSEDNKWTKTRKELENEFGLFWNNSKVSSKRIQVADKCYEQEKEYWPIWIRLESSEEIYHAVSGIMVILKVLNDQKEELNITISPKLI